ncbi:MAG TPA: glutamate 5-kinase [Myxococcaceae bacterium]|nr:glutamate 5-kinase [Myxococcaceae bacterium]
MSLQERENVKRARRVVVKVGTGALTAETGRFNRAHFEALCQDFSFAANGRELVVVSSGAIALGVERLGYAQRPKDIPGKQACAAAGQSRLVQAYEEALGRDGRRVAQILLTHDDVQDRRRYLNAKHVMERLISEGVVPVVNENDTVSIDEIKFSDNDTLAGLVAALLEADLLVILSDVEGLFSADPRRDPTATMLSDVASLTPEVMALAGTSETGLGVGGMWTKIRAARRVTELGIPCLITSGKIPGRLRQVLAGESVGTLFHPLVRSRTARGAWIAHVLRPKGRLRVDDGARGAVVKGKRSLLPSGIRAVEGTFMQGDPVDLVDEQGQVFARGLAAYESGELRRIAGRQSSEIESVLGYRYLDEAVHRDDLAVLS